MGPAENVGGGTGMGRATEGWRRRTVCSAVGMRQGEETGDGERG